ncbi:MAG: archease [Chloroflexota bacterium]
MDDRGHRLVEHTADTGIEAWGRTLDEAFEEAALALFEIIIDPAAVEERESHRIAVSGTDDGDLLVRWLNELLYLVDAYGLVFRRSSVERRAPATLVATAYGERLDPARHQPRSAVKAVTYHQLAVEPGPPAHVRVIVDL